MEQSSYIVRAGVHLFVMAGEARSLRLRVTRRDEADLGKLIEWVLGIADMRHRAWVNGEPDPYGLALPDGIGLEASGRRDGSGNFPGPSAHEGDRSARRDGGGHFPPPSLSSSSTR